jgi:DNA-binding transcriptional ArsR family regulator
MSYLRNMDTLVCIRKEADLKQIQQCRESLHELDNSISFFSDIFDLAGNSYRLQILVLLNRENRLCVCDLSDILGLSVSAVSQHLRKLKDKNLIFSTREGQTYFYSISESHKAILQPFLSMVSSNMKAKAI